MQTQLAEFIRDTPEGKVAEEILRKCVHCGFCTATCPTYQLTGDELDGPRGRIYQIKEILEGGPITANVQHHLDRCLTCRSCESTCPSGVQYARLLDIGRAVVEARVSRPLGTSLTRAALREFLPRRNLFTPAYKLGQAVRGLLPEALKRKVLPARPEGIVPKHRHARRMILMQGCVQPAMAPSINTAAARVLDRLGITLIAAEGEGCCGAVRFHLDAQEPARDDMRRNIDAWLPLLDKGAEGILVTASGCGVQVKEYGHALSTDQGYAAKAARVSAAARDVSEVVAEEKDALLALLAKAALPSAGKLAYHAPCTLQHGLRVRGVVEELLTAAGFELTTVAEPHLCCGSAGTYSVLQPEMSLKLRDRKLANLQAGDAPQIASANIGCMAHLQSGTDRSVKHWIELLDERLALIPQ